VNHARRDLCGGHPAMDVPTAIEASRNAERGFRNGRNPSFERFGQPDVVAIEADVFPAGAGRCGRQAAVLLDKGGMSPTKATRQTAPGRSMLYREI